MASLAEENNQVNEIYQSTKSELVKLQEQLEVEKSKVDTMVSEIKKLSALAAEKSVLETNFGEGEKRLKNSEAKLKEEVTIVMCYWMSTYLYTSLMMFLVFFHTRSKRLQN